MRDLVAGARAFNVTSSSPAGSAYVFSGATGSTIHSVTGMFADDQFGAAVLGLGDTSGDGIPDFAVGAPRPPCCSSGTSQAPGYLSLFSGADGSLLRSVTGTVAGDFLGMSLASLGDIDGDGLDDLAGGAPGNVNGLVVALSGASFSMLWNWAPGSAGFGYSIAALSDVSGADGSVIRSHLGLGTGNAHGISLARIADLDGDGVAEYAAGGRPDLSGTVPQNLPVLVRSGATGAVILTLQAGAPTDDFGATVADAGDVDGDGATDIAVGAPRFGLGTQPQPQGQVHLFSGATGMVLRTYTGATRMSLGTAIASAGDVDGDGIPDLAIGGPTATVNVLSEGVVRIYRGSDGSVLRERFGSTQSAAYGSSLANLGDIDGDGLDDLAVGAPANIGYPQQQGIVQVLSGATGSVIRGFAAGGLDGHFGLALASVGDWDGDGAADLAIGSPGERLPGGPAAGAVRVFSTATGAPLIVQAYPQIYSSGSHPFFGAAVASAGDVTGDGIQDLIAGAPGAMVGSVPRNGTAFILSYSGLPPFGGLFGQGCPQSDGRFPVIRIVGGPPTAQGNPWFGFLLSNAVPDTGAFLAVGLSDQSWNGNPLPLDLAPLGLQPACFLLVSVDVLMARTTGAGGIARVDIPIPANLGLLGLTVFAQWYVDEPGQPNRGAVSSGLRIQIL